MSCLPEEKYPVFSASGRNWPTVDSREMMKFYPSRTIAGKFELIKFVAVGNGGYVTTSTDGIKWTNPQIVIGTKYWNAVAYGNGKFVAVGNDGYITASTDGINWTTSQIKDESGKVITANLNGVCIIQ